MHRAIVNVRYTSNFLAAKQNKFMAEYGLSLAQFNILRILRGANDWISVNTVKERMVEKSPNTTRLMDKLLDKKRINRKRCNDDRRVVYVKISKKGLTLLAEIDERFEDERESMMPNTLSADEANKLSELLDKLRGE